MLQLFIEVKMKSTIVCMFFSNAFFMYVLKYFFLISYSCLFLKKFILTKKKTTKLNGYTNFYFNMKGNEIRDLKIYFEKK